MATVNKKVEDDTSDPRKAKKASREFGLQRSLKDVIAKRLELASLDGGRMTIKHVMEVPLHDNVPPTYIGDYRS
jgi:hypothetical protein